MVMHTLLPIFAGNTKTARCYSRPPPSLPHSLTASSPHMIASLCRAPHTAAGSYIQVHNVPSAIPYKNLSALSKIQAEAVPDGADTHHQKIFENSPYLHTEVLRLSPDADAHFPPD